MTPSERAHTFEQSHEPKPSADHFYVRDVLRGGYLMGGVRTQDCGDVGGNGIEMMDQFDDDHKTSELIRRGRCKRCDKYRELVVDPFCEDCWDYLNKHDS